MPHYFGPPAERRSYRYEAIEEAARADMVCEPTYQAAKVTRNCYKNRELAAKTSQE